MHSPAKALLISLLLIAFSAGLACAMSDPDGDIDGDHDIDLADLRRLVDRWLDPICLGPGCEEDLDCRNGVNMADFAVLAERWGIEGKNLVISELMAINRYSNYTTVQGQRAYSDWIEIYNPGPEAVNLSRWYLTDEHDEPSKWPLPGVTIGHNNYLLIFASDIQMEDHPTNYPYFDGAHYHTSFQLDGDGEYLALVDPHLYVVHEYRSFEYKLGRFGYPRQQQDFSYGLYEGNEQYFPNPTPGRANTQGYAQSSGEPHFSRPGGTFVDSFQLTLTTPAPGAVIRYTTNGSVPTASSTRYIAPFTLNNSAEITARVFEPGKAPGPFISQTYLALSNYLESVSSDIPIVVVDTYGSGIGGGSYTKCSAVFIEQQHSEGRVQRVRITNSADFAGRCGIRVRGSSTAGAPKHQFSFETWDERNQDTRVSIFGLPPDSDWILYAPLVYDRALINNPFIYELSNQIGRYAVRTRACELYLNTGGGKVSQSDYWGLYFFMEKIRINEERIDTGTLEPWDSTEPKVSGGYVIAIDRKDPDGNGFWTSRGTGRFVYVDPPEPQVTGTQRTWIRNYLNQFENALYGSNFTDPSLGYAKYIDVGSHIDHSLLNLLPMNVDAFRLSGYMAKYREGKLHAGPIWDFDRAMDSTDGRDNNPQTWHGTGDATRYFDYVWYARLHQNIDFWQRYIDRWYELRANQFSTRNINDVIDSMAYEIAEAAARNYARWSSYPPRFGGFQGEISHLKDWLATRAAWIDSQFVKPPQTIPDSSHVEAGTTVSLTNPNGTGTIYYTLDGSDPRVFGDSAAETAVLVAEDAPKKVLVPTGPVSEDWKGGNEPFTDATWNHGKYISDKTGGVGYDENANYEPYISYDVENLMNGDLNPGANTSCYIRIPFYIKTDHLAKLTSLTLKVRCDDAFIAYLNGRNHEVARTTNAPGRPTWISSSTGTGPQGAGFKNSNISPYISYLNAGNNILAIHALNSSNTSSDFLISAVLEAGLSTNGDNNHPGDISPNAVKYTGRPITLNISTRIKARVLVGSNPYSRWSGLANASFGITPVAENLRITEIMYHPLDSSGLNSACEEFIELKNIGPEILNLNLVRFTNGIDFTFGDLELAHGEYVLVVRNRPAFDARYPGYSGAIAGVYTGRLDNAGERIRLQDAIGQMILDFKYEDGWREITDGDGYSLTIIDPNCAPFTASDEGLVAHWKFDDGSGATTAIDSVGTNNGTLNDNATWTAGQIGGALSLDGSGDYVSLSAIAPLAADSVTAEAWIRVAGLTGVWNPILTQHNPSNHGYYLYVYDDKPAFYLIAGERIALARSPDVINTDEWYHIAGTNDGSHLRIYVDGRLKAGAPSLGLTGVNHNAYIGCDYTSAACYSGLIDDVRIYNRALSEYEFEGVTGPQDRWNRKDSWRPSAYLGGSPGSDDSGIIPNPGAIVINELLAHSPATSGNWIELYNTTDAQIDIAGWYLSDSASVLKKYRIADATKIDAGEYLVFYEDANFGELSTDPGKKVSFALSENGGAVYLSSAEGDVLMSYREVEDFGASATGVSFGRYFKRSTGNYNFVAMSAATPGLPNAYPKVGPIVINEIMYNPESDNQNREYVELRNIGPVDVTLYDSNAGEPWKFTDGISYTFPPYPGVKIPAGGYLLVIKDMTSYLAEYGIPPFGVPILGGYGGKLSNAGEKLELSMPGRVDESGTRCYIRIDRVNYSDGSHPDDCPGGVDLWPTEADGEGASLNRIAPTRYGNDPNNWTAATPSPGSANP